VSALPRAEIARLLEDHPGIPVVIDEAYADFGGESAVPLIADHPIPSLSVGWLPGAVPVIWVRRAARRSV
jgi:hypothetical protein